MMSFLHRCIVALLIVTLQFRAIGGLRVSSALRIQPSLISPLHRTAATISPLNGRLMSNELSNTLDVVTRPLTMSLSHSSERRASGSRLYLAGGGGQGQTIKKTGTTVLVEDEAEEDAEIKGRTSLKDEIDKDWTLILHDDTIHTIPEVASIISELVPLCAPARAWDVTLTVHTKGMAIIASGNKKLMEEYMHALQSAGLNVSIAVEDEFKGGDGSDDDIEPTDDFVPVSLEDDDSTLF